MSACLPPNQAAPGGYCERQVWVIFAHTPRGQAPAAERRLLPFARTWKRGPDPNGTLGAGSAGLAVGGAYLAVATGDDHLVDELGVARQDAPVNCTGGCDDLAVAA
jgi:hypothetical protein